MPKVVPLRPSPLPSVEIATPLGGEARVPGSRNEIWLTPAQGADGRRLMLYAKPQLTPRQLAVEVLAAQVGQAAGLPCPNSYVIRARSPRFGLAASEIRFAFGSEREGRGLASSIRDRNYLFEVLEQAKLLVPAIVFDEWIANPVRGPGDVLFDTEKGAVLIDHEAAMDASVRPQEAVINWLGDRVVESTPPAKRLEMLTRARDVIAMLGELDLTPTTVSALNSVPGAIDAYREGLHFLNARRVELDRLISRRLMPEQGYLVEPIRKDSNGT